LPSVSLRGADARRDARAQPTLPRAAPRTGRSPRRPRATRPATRRTANQRDYWKLVYNPAHHHFVRNFAVLFDSPIDGACGIQVTGLEPFDDTGTPNAAAQVDCSLNEGAAIGIEAHHYAAPPAP
jgi:hypothetical protein